MTERLPTARNAGRVQPGRLLRHLCTDFWSVRRAFPAASLAAIESAIAEGERAHGGEVRFVVESALPLSMLWRGAPARERAIQLFGELGVWDTEENCGVLVYVLLADHQVEIVADRGIDRRVGAAGWTAILERMRAEFRSGRFGGGAVAGVREISAVLAAHFPVAPGDRNELSDRPIVLD